MALRCIGGRHAKRVVPSGVGRGPELRESSLENDRCAGLVRRARRGLASRLLTSSANVALTSRRALRVTGTDVDPLCARSWGLYVTSTALEHLHDHLAQC